MDRDLGVHSSLSRTIQHILGYRELGGPTALPCSVLSGEMEVVNAPGMTSIGVKEFSTQSLVPLLPCALFLGLEV